MHDYFSSELTSGTMFFEAILTAIIIGILIYGIKNYKFFIWRFFALLFGIFAFEGLTAALWINSNLGSHAYIHNDISWVMTLTWGAVIIICKFIYDELVKKSILKNKILSEFIFVVLFSSIIGLGVLILLKTIGVFSYAPEMLAIIDTSTLFLGRPLEALIYFPVFMFSTFSFYKYWELVIYDKNKFDNYKINYGKDIFISSMLILLIGYLVHPILIVENIYIYGGLLVGFIFNLLITSFTVSQMKELPLFVRYISGTFIFTAIGSIIVSLFVGYGVLEFSQSILNTYTVNTIQMPFLNITDVEFGGILLFSYFIIAIVKYFKVITDNGKIVLDDNTMTFKGFKSLFTNQK